MVTIFWTFLAEEDLKEVFDYIAKGSRRYAFIQIEKIKQATQVLKSNMNAGRPLAEHENSDLRELIEGNYRIIYRVKHNNQIDILLVHHGARDLARRLYI